MQKLGTPAKVTLSCYCLNQKRKINIIEQLYDCNSVQKRRAKFVQEAVAKLTITA